MEGDPLEGPRQVGTMVEITVEAASWTSTVLTVLAILLGVFGVWIVLAGIGESCRNRRRK